MLHKYVPFPPGNQAGIFIRAVSIIIWYPINYMDSGRFKDCHNEKMQQRKITMQIFNFVFTVMAKVHAVSSKLWQ